MTNNRMLLRCRCCGASIIIAKHFLSPWHLVANADDKISKFFEEHYCCKNVTEAWHNSFELVSEFGEGFPREEDDILLHYYDIYNDDYYIETKKQDAVYKCEQSHSMFLKNVYVKGEENDNSNT